MANLKYIKLSITGLAVLALALGLGIGLGKKQAKQGLANGSSQANAVSDLDSLSEIDGCEDRRVLVVPGTEDYLLEFQMKEPEKRRTLIRRLGKEVEVTPPTKPGLALSLSSKSSKSGTSGDGSAKAAKSTKSGTSGDGSAKAAKSTKSAKCTKPSRSEKWDICTSKASKKSKAGRKLGKETEVPPPTQEQSDVPSKSPITMVGIDKEGTKQSKSSKTMAPTPCRPDTEYTSMVPTPSDVDENVTPRPTLLSPLVPAATSFPTSTSSIGLTQEGTPPTLSTDTLPPTPNSSDDLSPEPSSFPITPQPTNPSPTLMPTTGPTEVPTSADPTSNPTKLPTSLPTNEPSESPTSSPTAITSPPSFGATPTVSTEITGPPTKSGRDP